MPGQQVILLHAWSAGNITTCLVSR